MFYTIKIPAIIKLLFPSLVYNINNSSNSVYLTFDDGPHPATTPEILKILDKYKAKATFFCVGNNVLKYPGLFSMIIQKGHSVGNHTFNHLDFWKNNFKNYYDDIKKANNYIDSGLFRPPYGRLLPWYIKNIGEKYKIIMWDVLSGDFDPDTTVEKCYDNVVKNTNPGSIIVFHDSIKTKEKVLQVLPVVLDELKNRGFNFKKIKEKNEYFE